MIISSEFIDLGEAVDCLDKQRIPVSDEERQKRKGHVPYYGANGQVGTIDNFLFNDELLLLAEDGGSWGLNEKCAYIISGRSWVNNHAHVLKCKDGMDIHFLKYYLNYMDLRNYISGTTRGKLNQQRMAQIKIPNIDPEKQKKISGILNRVEIAIEKRRQTLRLADEFLKSAFLEMFGDPTINLKGWPQDRLTGLVDAKGGGTPAKNNLAYYEKGNIPWVSPKDMKSMFIETSQDKITDIAVKESSTKMIPGDSVLMVVRSGILKNKLPVALNKVPVALNQDMKAFIPNGKVNPYFLLFYFIIQERNLLKSVRGTTADNISSDVLRKFKVFVPPMVLQNKFADLVQKVGKYKEKLKQSEIQLQDLFNSLMQRAFKGELF